MTFFDYMMRHHMKRAGRKHDLANDMYSDITEFPKVSWEDDEAHDTVRRYLEWCRACDACLEVFEECWKEYVRSERNRQNA